MSGEISVVIEHRVRFFACCPVLPGCYTQGDTLEEAGANIREVAALYLETLDEAAKRESLSREVISLSVEVSRD